MQESYLASLFRSRFALDAAAGVFFGLCPARIVTFPNLIDKLRYE